MKYILPKGIEIEKAVVVDKKSLCMKPDLKITLVFEVVDHFEQSADLAFTQYSNSRLINFFNLHLQVDENLGHSFQKINVDQHSLNALDNNPSSLVELVNVIDSIFDSVKRTSISMTKEELLQKIMMNCLDFVEIREAEEQIEILEKTVPDWLCKKVVSSGDTMYCVKNALDLDSVRLRLLSSVTKGD
ncbi:putative DNA replication factor Cdt1 [Medicago truncatula]|nr:putative DNA replication factor Cdt1 [Medicago truncatula]